MIDIDGAASVTVSRSCSTISSDETTTKRGDIMITRDTGTGSCIVSFEEHLLIRDGWAGSRVRTERLFSHATGSTFDILRVAARSSIMLTWEYGIGDETFGKLGSHTNPGSILAHKPYL
jgi:hypothetical protein